MHARGRKRRGLVNQTGRNRRDNGAVVPVFAPLGTGMRRFRGEITGLAPLLPALRRRYSRVICGQSHSQRVVATVRVSNPRESPRRRARARPPPIRPISVSPFNHRYWVTACRAPPTPDVQDALEPLRPD